MTTNFLNNMAENRRENQEARSQEDSGQMYNRGLRGHNTAPPTGFEGMNFEQRRGPYRGGNGTGINRSNPSEENKGSRREDFNV